MIKKLLDKIFMKRRGKKKNKNITDRHSNKFYGELSLDDFKKHLLTLYKQECALDDDRSYFEPQDTLFGEMFDNAMRIKMLKEENKIHEGEYNDSEIMEEAKKQYAADLELALKNKDNNES